MLVLGTSRATGGGAEVLRRQIFVLTTLGFACLTALPPVRAEQGQSRMSRLEDRVELLEADLSAFESVVLAIPIQQPEGGRLQRPDEIAQSRFHPMRFRRLQRRVADVRHRVAQLEDRLLVRETRDLERPAKQPEVTTQHVQRRRVARLAESITNLEARVRLLKRVVLTPEPIPSPAMAPPPDAELTGAPKSSPNLSRSRVTCRGVQLKPDVDLQAAVTNGANGTTFCLDPGVYRLSGPLVLREGQKLIGTGKRGAIISGARVVRASRQASYWVITGQTSLGTSGQGTIGCRAINGADPMGMCVYTDQVFLNNRSLWQVGSLQELSSGEFFWDYATNVIYLGDDPTGDKLEVSVTTGQISGEPNVKLKNLVVEKLGSPYQGGAISASSHWTITGVEVRLNAGGGIHMGPYTVVRNSFIHHNGQLGIHGGQAECAGAKGLILEDSELSHNNAAGYDWSWEGGATKWTFTDGLIVRGNYVHDNYGSGLWTDVGNIRTLFEGNVVEDNYASGIVHELGYRAVIRNNTVRRTGLHHPVPDDVWGGGIFIDQSRDVQVYGNVVQGNHAGITAVQEPAANLCGMGEVETVNLRVHANTIRQPTGVAAGLRLWNEPDQIYYTGGNNLWYDNHYVLGNPSTGLHYYWANNKLDAEAWRSYGQD
jgi:Right handed beta helix region